MMRFIPKPIHVVAAVLLALPLLLRADAPADATEKLTYVKPSGATDNTRVEMKRVRGSKDVRIPDELIMFILCPDHTGLTVQEHPSVFWFMNKPVKDVQFKLTVTTEGEPEPLLEKVWTAANEVGIQRVDLKDIAKGLEPNTDYKVSVTILLNSKDHSTDLGTSGQIKRIAVPEKLVTKLLARPTPGERAVVYAKQGIWYDALAAISDQIAADPKNKGLHQERADLLKQVNLPQAAEYDAALGGN